MVTVTLDSKLSAVLGGKSAKKLAAAFEFQTVGDLLAHYPRAWMARGETSKLADLVEGEHTTVVARIARSKPHVYTDRRTGQAAYRLEVVVELADGDLHLTFFDKKKGAAKWRHDKLEVGKVGMFAGRATTNRYQKDRWELVHPAADVLEDVTTLSVEEQAAEEKRWTSRLRPIYPASKNVSSWSLEGAIRLVLEVLEEVPDTLPASVRLRHGLIGARQALQWLHQPDSWQEKQKAEERLRFEEAFVIQTWLALRRAELAAMDAQPRTGVPGGLLDRFDARLPFELTAGQREVGEQILADLAQDHPMHRLLQGEVGSGKTVVALRAMLRVVDSGGQAALLAPTEVLAQQHHRSISALLGDLAGGGMLGGAEDATRVALLTGSLGAAARKEALLDAASGAAGIVVGTHALLEERVQFADLGLVVVDEQHRFGVEQRAALTEKGANPPHVLVMTATPIPRTVAMTVFGDLETSTLAELPAGRAPIATSVVPMLEKPDWLARGWSRIREEAESGRQTYIVCPRIGGEEARKRLDAEEAADPVDDGTDDSGGAEGDAKPQLAAVEEIAPLLAEGALAGLRVEMLHGRLAPDVKDAVMRRFAAGEIDVLVSTTVVEVGVDVANAAVMMILDAERFGVSQLHQLRGRVGRGGLPGLCLLVTRSEPGSAARDRLDAVAATVDGFELSRVDLQQRREGDVLGATQSGRRSSLRLLSVLEHEDVISDAREAAVAVVAEHPDLAAYPGLQTVVAALAESEHGHYLEKA